MVEQYANYAEPWWLLLMRAYEKRGTEGRLGLAYLTAAGCLLFGDSLDAEKCLQEISANQTTGVMVFRCGGSGKPVLGIDQYSPLRRETGLIFSSGITQQFGTDDGAVIRQLVQDANDLIEAGTPSFVPNGLQSYKAAAFSPGDLSMIDDVRRQLSC